MEGDACAECLAKHSHRLQVGFHLALPLPADLFLVFLDSISVVLFASVVVGRWTRFHTPPKKLVLNCAYVYRLGSNFILVKLTSHTAGYGFKAPRIYSSFGQ